MVDDDIAAVDGMSEEEKMNEFIEEQKRLYLEIQRENRRMQ